MPPKKPTKLEVLNNQIQEINTEIIRQAELVKTAQKAMDVLSKQLRVLHQKRNKL